MVTKITYHMMPWEIDYALMSFTQFKKSKYYLDPNDRVKIDTFLNLSSYIIDWDNSKLPKEFFIQKYKDLQNLLCDYEHTPFIYEGDECWGILDKQRMAYDEEVDYYMELCPDMYFQETLIASLIEAAKSVPNKYFVITPQLYKMWDYTWDVLVDNQYLTIPYDQWDKADLFDIRWDLKSQQPDMSLRPINVSKWANWFDLYNKAFYEEMIPVHDDWHGYGPGDTYGMVVSEYAKSRGVDFQQYVLEGQTIFEYPIGPLKQRNFTSAYRDLIVTRDVPNQRQVFEAKFNEYVNKGIQMLIDKKIIC
jgi:hypothetical protein